MNDSLGLPIPETMRALVLDGTGFDHLHIALVPTPKPGPNQMLARVDAAGICTSLIKLVEQGPDHPFVYGWDISKYPLILGDEGAVTLVQIGENLKGQYKPGSRFVVQPAVHHAPINHQERYPDNGRGITQVSVSYTLGGHLAEYILITEEILEANCLLPILDSTLCYSHAATCEPISCIISAQDHHLHLVQEDEMQPRSVSKGVKKGGTTVIVGAGTMGRIHVDLALSYGPRTIIVADFIEERLERTRILFAQRALELGVELIMINAGQKDLSQFVKEKTDWIGADDIIIAVGSRKAIEGATDYIAKGGVLNLFGGLKKGDELVNMDTIAIHYKSINVTGSSGGSPWDMKQTLDLMVKGQINPSAHITQIGDLDHAIELIQMVKAQQIDGKAIVYPHRRTDAIYKVDSWAHENEVDYLTGNWNPACH